MGFLEVDLETRKATGHCALVQIPDRKAATLKARIQEFVAEGSLIFTDKLKSYQWLSGKNSKFVHRCVNHSKGEFARTETLFGVDVRVTTNAVEGLFGRLKKYFRQRGLGRVGKDAYGHLLAEFLFRQRCTATKTECLPAFLHEILVWQSEHPNKKVFETKLQDCIPDSVLADFSALIGDEEGEGSNLESEPVRLQSPVLNHAPVLNPAHVKREMDASESDCEIISVQLHPKAGMLHVKEESGASSSAALPVAEPPKQVDIFCPQGHSVFVKDLPERSVFKKRRVLWVEWSKVVCDVCSLETADPTYRCEACDWDICSRCAKSL